MKRMFKNRLKKTSSQWMVVACCILILTFLPGGLKALDNSGIGYHGAAFLRINPSARQVAMGEAFSALADDINLLRFNVAGLGNLRHIMLAANFHNWIEDTQQGELGLALPSRFGVFGLDMTYFNEGEIAELDELFRKTGNYQSSGDMLLTFAYGTYIPVWGRNLNLGGGIKLLNQNLVGEHNTSFGLDLGAKLSINPLSFGTTVQNVGLSKIKFDQEQAILPLTYRFGTAYKYKIEQAVELNVALDAAWTTKEKMRYYTGGEFIISDLLAFRAGYKIHDTEASRWSVGFGLNIPMVWLARSQTRLDYAYSELDAFEMKAHRFSLLFTFGVAQEVLPLGVSPEYADMSERLRRELEAAERARLASEDAEARYKRLGAEMAKRLARIQQIAAESEGKIEVEPQTEKKILVSMRINFDFDKANIRREEFPTMHQVGEILNTYPEASVHISGHTDAIGPDEYNIRLSQRRIDSVMVFLANKEKVSLDRFYMPVGYGETRPIATNATPEGRFRNRRVEFLLFTFDAQPEIPEGSAIKAVERVNNTTVRIVCNGKVKFETKTLDNPERLVIDFPNIFLLTDMKSYELNAGAFIRGRVGYHPNEKFSRVVFDLTRKVSASVQAVDNYVVITEE